MTQDPPRGVLFDAAGTLIEPREPVGKTYARVAREHGARISAWRMGDAFARVIEEAPPMVFPDAPPGEIDALERGWWRDRVRATFRAADSTARLDDVDVCFDRLYATFAAPGAWRARAGAAEALSELRRRGLATGVVSNFDRRLGGLLAGLGLAPLLDVVVLPSDARVAKPDPRIFALALERLHLVAGEVVFVGDHAVRDVEASRAAGLRAIDVTSLATLADLPDRLAAPAEECTP